jgi:hypothetical protein
MTAGRRKTWGLVLVFIAVLGITFGTTPARAVTVTVGVDQVVTSMDYGEAWFEDDPGNVLPWPQSRTATAGDNVAQVALDATSGEAGVAKAAVGILIEWDFGNRSYDEVMQWPVRVTVDCSYEISAYWVLDTGSANATVDLPFIPNGLYDAIGYETGAAGSRQKTVTYTFDTTIEELNDRDGIIAAGVYCQAHAAQDFSVNSAFAAGGDGRVGIVSPNVLLVNSSAARVTVHSIAIRFLRLQSIRLRPTSTGIVRRTWAYTTPPRAIGICGKAATGTCSPAARWRSDGARWFRFQGITTAMASRTSRYTGRHRVSGSFARAAMASCWRALPLRGDLPAGCRSRAITMATVSGIWRFTTRQTTPGTSGEA